MSINEANLWLVDVKTGGKTPLTPPQGAQKVFFGDARFSRDGRSIYVLTDADSEFHRLALLRLDTRHLDFLTSSIPWDVDAFDLSQDGRRVAFVANERGQSVVYELPAPAGTPQLVPGLPAGVQSP